MNYGFVIDNRSCIGCHACSTACKSENSVPLGVYRTWVKTTEVGTFPDVQRHFQVTRCNHCANPPCVRICPTAAMYQRDDGIVEFDGDACIGCKACLQACPYDAIHIDPETGTAAKCHYCSHRVEVGLEPACAVVCPTHAIVAGDLDDPRSEISRVLSREKVTVRKPEQGTAPKVFYIDGAAVNLVPTATERAPSSFAAADVLSIHGDGTGPDHGVPDGGDPVAAWRAAASAGGRAAPQPQGSPASGPLALGRRMAGNMVRVNYNAQHRVPWHWPVPAYLVTKGIGCGVFLLLAAAFGLGWAEFDPAAAVLGGALSLAMMLATTALLVLDLEHPGRFLFILRRPQWRSWLARGAVALIGFTTVVALWLAAEAGAMHGLVPAGLAGAARGPLLLLGFLLALGAAVYTAFLFGQAEGRDLWQSPLLPAHLAVQAVFAGAAAMLAAAPLVDLGEDLLGVLESALILGLVADVFLLLLGEFGMPHGTETAARAAREITRGRYRAHFWIGAVGLGHAVPLNLAAAGGEGALALAGLSALAGLWLYEHAFVMAPQEIPNS